MHPSALIAEPDEVLSRDLRRHLEREGFRVQEAPDGTEALDRAEREPVDLMVAEWALPGLEGPDLCRLLRRRGMIAAAPVVLLTDRERLEDKIRAYDSGVDDYLVKPFALPELIARVRAVMRRAMHGAASERVLAHGDVTLDVTRRRVFREGRDVHLGPMMFRVLHSLMSRPGHVFTREELLKSAWGGGLHVEPRTIDVHIRRLRHALNTAGERDVIRTVRGGGYAFEVPHIWNAAGAAAE